VVSSTIESQLTSDTFAFAGVGLAAPSGTALSADFAQTA
jgi:hypothetical protein